MTRQNPVTAERLRELLHYDPETGVFTWLVASGRMKIGDPAGAFNSEGYQHVQIDGRKYKAHRLAWLLMTNAWPRSHIDHINLDKADNRFFNLREATPTQNQGNTRAHANNASGFKGVHWQKKAGKWRAQIRVNGGVCYLGLFAAPEAAHAAYFAAANKHFGEFARAK